MFLYKVLQTNICLDNSDFSCYIININNINFQKNIIQFNHYLFLTGGESHVQLKIM